jgi:hypothetical protein
MEEWEEALEVIDLQDRYLCDGVGRFLCVVKELHLAAADLEDGGCYAAGPRQR